MGYQTIFPSEGGRVLTLSFFCRLRKDWRVKMESLSWVSGFSIELFKQLCRLHQAQALPHFAFSFAHLFQISQFYLLTFILRFSWAILSFCSEESWSSFSDYVYFLWLYFFIYSESNLMDASRTISQLSINSCDTVTLCIASFRFLRFVGISVSFFTNKMISRPSPIDWPHF